MKIKDASEKTLSLEKDIFQLECKIHTLKDKKRDVEKCIKKFKHEYDLAEPRLTSDFKKAYGVEDDATEGSMRRRFEDIVGCDQTVFDKMCNTMNETVDQLEYQISKIDLLIDEYNQQISSLKKEIDNINEQTWLFMLGG